MANYNATVTSPLPPEEVFEYVADFRTVAEWDPSISKSEHINDGEPIQEGAQYTVTTEAAGQEIVLDYTTIELDRPRRIVLRGENESVVSIDTITLEPNAGGGTDVTYDAELELKGAKKLADPVVHLGFQRVGDKARDGLADKLKLRD